MMLRAKSISELTTTPIPDRFLNTNPPIGFPAQVEFFPHLGQLAQEHNQVVAGGLPCGVEGDRSGDWWWYLARSVKVARYNFWVNAEHSRNDISRTMRTRNTPMGCLRAEGKRDAHYARRTEDIGAEMGNGTRRGRCGGRRSARGPTKSGIARRNPRSGSPNAVYRHP
jgi:hypothetical protein